MSHVHSRTLMVVSIAAILTGASAMMGAGQTPSEANVQGGELFKANCASCHGASGHGNGPVAAMLRHKPADLTLFAMQNGGTFPSAKVHRIIDGRDVASHGSPEMPVWGSAFKSSPDHPGDDAVSKRIDAIVRYLESIQVRHGH